MAPGNDPLHLFQREPSVQGRVGDHGGLVVRQELVVLPVAFVQLLGGRYPELVLLAAQLPGTGGGGFRLISLILMLALVAVPARASAMGSA